MDLKDQLRQLGWSEQLIDAVDAVAKKVQEGSVNESKEIQLANARYHVDANGFDVSHLLPTGNNSFSLRR